MDGTKIIMKHLLSILIFVCSCSVVHATPFSIEQRVLVCDMDLVKEQSALEYRGELGKGILHFASRTSCFELVNELIKHVEISNKDNHGATALFDAVFDKNSEVALTLVREGIDITAKEERLGTTVLEVAAEHNMFILVETLLERGLDPNEKNKINGNTPLFGAVLFGRERVVELLMKFGADPSIKNKHGQTALDYAKTPIERSHKILKMLKGTSIQ